MGKVSPFAKTGQQPQDQQRQVYKLTMLNERCTEMFVTHGRSQCVILSATLMTIDQYKDHFEMHLLLGCDQYINL